MSRSEAEENGRENFVLLLACLVALSQIWRGFWRLFDGLLMRFSLSYNVQYIYNDQNGAISAMIVYGSW
jgi:hypothetical protein